jgi:uncharacterized protein (TIGR02001 family)
MKKTSIALAIGSLTIGAMAMSLATTAVAAEVSGNIALGTDYKFRGISQSDGEAISGGFDVAFDNGFYVGTWGSSIEDWGNGLELDYYAGYGGAFNEAVSFDVGLLAYTYPNEDSGDLDYNEIYGSIGVADFTFGFAYSDDYFAGTGDFTYLYVDYSYALSESYSLDLHLADNSIDDEEAFGTPDYLDYSIGVSTSFEGLDLSLSYIDTDLSESDCFGGDDLCKGSVVLTLSKSL